MISEPVEKAGKECLMSPEQGKPEKPNLYDKSNDAVRLDSFCEPDDAVMVALRSFFRKLDTAYLFDERVLPTLKVEGSVLFAAVRDRPWPPWGHGARQVCALIQANPVGDRSYGLSPVYVRNEDASNIGLRAALYKEMLENLSQNGKAEVNYLVIEGSVVTDRVLRSLSFERGNDLVVTENARYFFYRADAGTVLNNLHLSNISVPELLAHQFGDAVLNQNSLLQGVLDWGRLREVIPIDGGSFDASLPGGPPPSPPSAIEIGGIDVIGEE
jgi:hypothetical protein